ncbi:hypothetical protein J5N97_013915 [Dioscorea zingiberensis]|uniref:NAB domain-containing protein n=1 Tax=Dioscorea zingiberensis TaxID=325984 RepID=A0A9D5CRE1_9LILI|nr:hypothetical protein J5N97_013915 [Dioscorea zingiberensis]
MLQRAASNAYSWWWASHIRTSQSKWLDNNLQEMEEKMKSMLKIIDEEADSFAKRAEMYYKKRPELMNYVEETYKAYKALAESTSSVIDDDEARALMAAAALKSCEDTLVNLQEQQNRTTEEARIEYERIKKAEAKLKALRGQPSQPQMETRDVSGENAHSEEQVCVLKPERLELQAFCDKVKQHFEMNSEASVVELAEKIDELVEKVISLEITISSQTAEIRKLRSETDELQKHLQGLEEEKTTQTDDSNIMNVRLKQAEEKLQMIQDLEKCVKDEKNILSTHFTEACHSLNDLSEKLQSPKSQDEIISSELKGGETKEVAKIPNHKGKESKVDAESCTPSKTGSQPESASEKEVPCIQDIRDKLIEESARSHTGSQVGEDLKDLKILKVEKGTTEKSVLVADDSICLSDEPDDQEGVLNLQRLLSNGVEGREKMFSQYSSILRNYKEMKKKLSEVEKKNQDSLGEIIAQLRELKNHVRGLQVEVEKALSKLQESFELSGQRNNHGNHHQYPMRNLSSKTKIPLRSFLYGVKPKKPSIFSCMSPALQKQYSHMRAGFPT